MKSECPRAYRRSATLRGSRQEVCADIGKDDDDGYDDDGGVWSHALWMWEATGWPRDLWECSRCLPPNLASAEAQGTPWKQWLLWGR